MSVESHLTDATRYHRAARAWSLVLVALAAVIVLGLLRGLWPPTSTQLPSAASTDTDPR
jgi:hypothetical protein